MIDFDQLLAKQPGRTDAVFGWHQDQAYSIDTDDRRTATCWLAVDDSTIENGCLQFLSGEPPCSRFVRTTRCTAIGRRVTRS